MPASVAAAVRFTMAALVLLPLLKGMMKNVLVPSLEIGLLMGAGYYAQGISLTSGGADASTAAFICSLAVVVCPLMDLLQGTRALGQREISCVLLAVVGTAILELGGAVPSAGDLWAMAQPFCFGVGFWKVEQLMAKFPKQANAITALQVQAVALFSIIWAAVDVSHAGSDLPAVSATLSSFGDVLSTDARLLPALLWTSCFTTALTVWLETKALGKLSAAETSLLFSTEPLWGTAFAAAALGENIHQTTWMGGAMILAACAWRQQPQDGPAPAAPAPAPLLPAAAVRHAGSYLGAEAAPAERARLVEGHRAWSRPVGYIPQSLRQRAAGAPGPRMGTAARVDPGKRDVGQFRLASLAAFMTSLVSWG